MPIPGIDTGGGGFSGSSSSSAGGNDQLSNRADFRFGSNYGITFGGARTRTDAIVTGAAIVVVGVVALFLFARKRK